MRFIRARASHSVSRVLSKIKSNRKIKYRIIVQDMAVLLCTSTIQKKKDNNNKGKRALDFPVENHMRKKGEKKRVDGLTTGYGSEVNACMGRTAPSGNCRECLRGVGVFKCQLRNCLFMYSLFHRLLSN